MYINNFDAVLLVVIELIVMMNGAFVLLLGYFDLAALDSQDLMSINLASHSPDADPPYDDNNDCYYGHHSYQDDEAFVLLFRRRIIN